MEIFHYNILYEIYKITFTLILAFQLNNEYSINCMQNTLYNRMFRHFMAALILWSLALALNPVLYIHLFTQ